MSGTQLYRRIEPRFVLVALAFGLTSSLIRPFFSNQNTYLLHAAARSGRYEALGADWWMHTTDPVPLFTWFATALLRSGLGSLVAVNAMIGAAFLIGLVECAARLSRAPIEREHKWLVGAALSSCWLACPMTWRMTVFEGVAEQYAYRGFLQPSNAGVALVWMIAAFMAGRPRVAVLLGMFATALHGTYLLPLVCTSAGFLLHERPFAQRERHAVVLLCVGVVLVGGTSAWRFSPTDAATFQSATELLVTQRIPHHADPCVWMGPSVAFQAILFVVGVSLCGRRGAWVLSLTAGLAACLTLAVWAVPSAQTLALMFPWRVFAILLPITSTVIIASGVRRGLAKAPQTLSRVIVLAFFVCTAIASVSGVRKMMAEPTASVALARQLRTHWLESNHDATTLVDPAWDQVRLNADIPIFVDFKSHPYRDVEVMAWWRRIRLARAFYSGRDSERCSALEEIVAEAPTLKWILTSPGFPLSCRGVHQVDKDDNGTIYRIDAVASASNG